MNEKSQNIFSSIKRKLTRKSWLRFFGIWLGIAFANWLLIFLLLYFGNVEKSPTELVKNIIEIDLLPIRFFNLFSGGHIHRYSALFGMVIVGFLLTVIWQLV